MNMDIYMVWGLVDGEVQMVGAFDEYSIEENPNGWQEIIDEARNDSDYETYDVCVSSSDKFSDDVGQCAVTLIWVNDKSNPGEPWLFDAWTEYDIDNNPEGFEEKVKQAKNYHFTEITVMSVDENAIRKNLTSANRV